MINQCCVAHDIPGRIRLIINGLNGRRDYKDIKNLLCSLKGVKHVRINLVINSLLIEYDSNLTNRKQLLQFISLVFGKASANPIDNFITGVNPKLRRDVFYSVLTGLLLLASITRKTLNPTPDVLDYIALAATAFTVLSHGETDRLKHPDVITGIVSMFSLGPNKIRQASTITWGVNLLEIFLEIFKGMKSSNKNNIQTIGGF